MSEENKSQDASVESIDRSPLTIAQKNYMKRAFNAHKDETEHAIAQHKREVGKIFTDYSKQVAESVGTQNKEMVKSMNESLATIDKKFSGMYGVLINKFLVKQEEKVFLAELGVQAVLEETAVVLADIKFGKDAPLEVRQPFYDEFQKAVEDKITSLAEQMKTEAQEKMAQAKEGSDVATPQEVVEQPQAAEAPQPSAN